MEVKMVSGTGTKRRKETVMSIFNKIMSSIFGFGEAKAAPAAATAAPSASQPGAAPMAGVDVEAVLTQLASQNKQKLDWRKSIVDLMKLLDLDSSLSARKELAQELRYTGSTDDTATMNMWLHKQVMQKLAENGGKVPDDLKS
jgi:hypothetical protein